MFNFPYVKSYNMQTLNYHEGFLVKEVDNTPYIVYKEVYFWLKSIQSLDKISLVDLVQWDQNWFSKPFSVARIMDLNPEDTWYFSFPLDEFSIKHLCTIVNFFDWYGYDKNNGIGIVERLEKAINVTKNFLPEKILSEIVCFIIYNLHKESFEEIRFLLIHSVIIHPYLKKT